MIYVPILIAILMEIFQSLHFTNGRFYRMDLIFSTRFWGLGILCTRTNIAKEALFRPINTTTIYCIVSYAIVYLAHVNY